MSPHRHRRPARTSSGVSRPRFAPTVTPLEDRSVPAAMIAAGDATFALDVGATGVTVTRTGDLTPQVTVGFQILDGTAINGTNYQASPTTGTLFFATGVTSQQVPFSILPAEFAEPSRAFTVDLIGVVDVLGPPPTFAGQQTFTTGGAPFSVSSADVNGDGRPDLLVANAGSTSVSVLLNTTAPGATAPSFAAKQDFTTGTAPLSVSSDDVNGDGRPDLLVANAGSTSVSVLLNTTAPGASTPSFAPEQDFTTGSNPSSVSSADVNGDGRPDLLVANSFSDTVSVLLNTTAPGATTPSFAAKQDFDAGTAIFSVSSADVNGDGRHDLVTANSGADTASVLLNTTAPGATTPSFAPKQDFTTGTNPASVSIADVNGDGRPDLITANTTGSGIGSNTISVLLNTTAAGATTLSFAAKQDFATGTDPFSVFSADVNGDGRPDLLTANRGSGSNSVSVLLNTTAPGATTLSFAPKQDLATGATPFAVSSADVNGDGKPDLLVANSGSASVSVLLNTTSLAEATPDGVPTPVFAPAATPAVGTRPVSVAAADINGDGKPDLITADYAANTVSVLVSTTAPGSTTPTYAPRRTFATGLGPQSVTVADITGDGKPDLIVADYNGTTLSVLVNTTAPGSTTPTFAPRQTFGTGFGPQSVTVADINGDFQPDLIVANFQSNSVAVLRNTSTPGSPTLSFATGVAFNAGLGPLSVAAADVNGDGKPDLIVANSGDNNVKVLMNSTATGSATLSFNITPVFATGTRPSAVAVADINGDGRPDVLVANYGSNNVSVLLNTTTVGFASPTFAETRVAVGSRPYSIAAADVNGDGKPDLVVANSGSNTVSVLFNTTTPGATTPAFAPRRDIATGTNPNALAIADVNGDGRADLLVSNYKSNTVSVLLNSPAVLTGDATVTILGPPAPPAPPAPPTPTQPPLPTQFAVGGDVGSGQVKLFNADQSVRLTTEPFPGFTGGVRVASADFNGDGVADLVVGTGPGIATLVRVLDGVTQAELFAIAPFESTFTGGVFVAAGDLTGDGIPELVISPDEGGGPRVRVFNGAGFGQLADFFGIDDDNFRGGARAAVGDINGDGVGDLIVAAGFGGGPRVAVFDGTTIGSADPGKLLGDFFAFEETLRNGTFVAAGDVDGDGFGDLIAGGGPGGGPRVSVFDGKALLGNVETRDADFFAGDETNRGGVRVAAADLDGDTRADVLAGAGTGAGSRVTAYAGAGLGRGTPTSLFEFDAFPGFAGGVFVG